MIEHALTSLPPLLHHHLTFIICSMGTWSFSDSSVGKECACNAGNLVPSLGWEDPLEKGMATHFSLLAWRIPMDRGAWRATVYRVAENQTRLSMCLHAPGNLNAGPFLL